MVGVAMIRQSGVNITIITPLTEVVVVLVVPGPSTFPPSSPIFSQDQP